jgi:hypothetical protein
MISRTVTLTASCTGSRTSGGTSCTARLLITVATPHAPADPVNQSAG